MLQQDSSLRLERLTEELILPIDKHSILCYYTQASDAMERYRSGYNGAVLKTVVRQRTVGSNPTLSANRAAERGRLPFPPHIG